VAVAFAKEGADVAIAYLDEHDDATRTAALVENTGRRCLRLPGSPTSGTRGWNWTPSSTRARFSPSKPH